jgi:hypothetical protein
LLIIDSHAHCGVGDRYPPQSFEDYYSAVKGSPISGVAVFAPVMEIYDRYDPFFKDSPTWQQRRKTANDYVLSLSDREIDVFPYFFIWNDFAADQLTHRHYGIKWHRHDDEPTYNYDDPACAAAMAAIVKRNLPIVLEEEFSNTERFIDELASDATVIIPHLGMLNGGFRRIAAAGLWGKPNVWADTALASSVEIMEYIRCYGHRRLLFGSDFPFGHPVSELEKVLRLNIDESIKEDICGNNLMRLYARIRHADIETFQNKE